MQVLALKRQRVLFVVHEPVRAKKQNSKDKIELQVCEIRRRHLTPRKNASCLQHIYHQLQHRKKHLSQYTLTTSLTATLLPQKIMHIHTPQRGIS